MPGLFDWIRENADEFTQTPHTAKDLDQEYEKSPLFQGSTSDSAYKKGLPDPLGFKSESLIGGQLNEWFNGQNPYSAEGQQRTANQVAMNFNEEEALKQRSWEEEMSNTSYQRAMADMQKAGVNPMLSYSQGGATTPGGQAASTSASQTARSNPLGVMGKMAAMITGLIATGARMSQLSNDSMAKIISNEQLASLKNNSAITVAKMRDDTTRFGYALRDSQASDRLYDARDRHLDKINYGYLTRHKKEY